MDSAEFEYWKNIWAILSCFYLEFALAIAVITLYSISYF